MKRKKSMTFSLVQIIVNAKGWSMSQDLEMISSKNITALANLNARSIILSSTLGTLLPQMNAINQPTLYFSLKLNVSNLNTY
jgi:hypothetical protein